MSKSSNPTALDTNNWVFYSIDMSEPHETCDYPGNPGYNADAFVFTYNMFPGDGSGNYHTEVAELPQSALAAGSGFSYLTFDLSNFNYRPVTMHDSSSGGPMWFVQDQGGGSNKIDLVRVDNITTSPTVYTFPITVNTYGGVNKPKNPNGTTITPGPNGVPDTRILKAAQRYNEIVASQNIGVNSNEDDSRWYEFNVSNINAPYLVQQGQVGYGANTYTVYPSIDINYSGDLGMGFTKVGNDTSTDYMSTYITGQKSGLDGLGVMETPVQTRAGDSNNTNGRMGDFSGINVDPYDGTFWAIDEYTTGSTSHEEIANFQMNTQNFYLFGSVLYIYGDQLASNYNDYITVDVNGRGGAYVTLNGEAAGFDPGQVSLIEIYPYGGGNTINVYNTNAAVYIQSAAYDTVDVGNGYDGLQGINGYVQVTNPPYYTQLNIYDTADWYSHTASVYNNELYGLSPAPIYWNNGDVSSVNIYGGYGGNTWWVYNTVSNGDGASTYIQSGSYGSSNTVNVLGTTGFLSVDGGSGFQAVYVGSNGYGFGGTLANINGVVDVYNTYNTYGYTYLYVDDSGDSTGRTMNMNFDSITDTGMPSTIEWTTYGSGYGGVYYLQVRGGSGFNTFNVYSTGSGPWSYGTDLYTGTGGATVNVYSTLGYLYVDNQGGQDYVYVGSDGTNSDSTMANINGYVDVYGAGSTYLYLGDSGDGTGRSVTMYDGALYGLSTGNIYWSPSSSSTGGVTYLDIWAAAAAAPTPCTTPAPSTGTRGCRPAAAATR